MPLSAAELEPLLRLASTEGVGPIRLRSLVERFGSAEDVMAAPASTLRAVRGIGAELAERIRRARSPAARTATRAALAQLKRFDAVALTPDDPLYPSSFTDLPDAPYLLFSSGDLTILRRTMVAIVGTRTPTAYGREAAETLARDLAAAGFAVASGMARGIDAAAHRGALLAQGATVGVLGHGIEQVYPPESRTLFREVRSRGLLLTEYPPGETPKPGNFPRRNRLITALSRAVVVVEMSLRSGAQHTVNYALEQGKEVMAVPGPIGSRASEGTNQLIKDGARMVTSATDVIEELMGVGSAPGLLPTQALPSGPAADLGLMSETEGRLLEALDGQSMHVDQLAAIAGVKTARVLITLLDLELRGLVQAEPGKRFRRTVRR